MTEFITNKEIVCAQVLRYAISSTVTKLVAETLDNIVICNEDDVQSFLSRYFKFGFKNSSCNNYFLKHVYASLKNYYDTNNRTYPDSFTKINLDITNLSAIQINLLDSEEDELFEVIRNIRNKCFHLKYVSETEYTKICDELRDTIPIFSHLNSEEKKIYLAKLNYLLKNLVITDVQFLLKKQFEKIINLFTCKG